MDRQARVGLIAALFSLALVPQVHATGATPVGRGVLFTCQTSAPAPVNTYREWVRCSDGHYIQTSATNVDQDVTFGFSATGVTPGSYTNASITVGVDGRLSAAANGSGGGGGGGYATVQQNGAPVTPRTTLNFTPRFSCTDNGSSTRTDCDLSTSGVSAASYTNANVTVDAYGRVTTASNGTGTAIGVPVSGGSTNVVLFTDGSNHLAQDNTSVIGFFYDKIAHILNFNSAVFQNSIEFLFNDGSYTHPIRFGNLGNGAFLEIVASEPSPSPYVNTYFAYDSFFHAGQAHNDNVLCVGPNLGAGGPVVPGKAAIGICEESYFEGSPDIQEELEIKSFDMFGVETREFAVDNHYQASPSPTTAVYIAATAVTVGSGHTAGDIGPNVNIGTTAARMTAGLSYVNVQDDQIVLNLGNSSHPPNAIQIYDSTMNIAVRDGTLGNAAQIHWDGGGAYAGSYLTIGESVNYGTLYFQDGPSATGAVNHAALHYDNTAKQMQMSIDNTAWQPLAAAAWSATYFGLSAVTTNFTGPFRSQGNAGRFRQLNCSWSITGVGGTTGVVGQVWNDTDSSEVCACTLGACTTTANAPLSCDCNSAFVSAKAYAFRIKSTSDCGTYPTNVVCNIEVTP